MKESENIKDQIEDLKQNNRVIEHIVAFENLTIGAQELLVTQIGNNEKKIQVLETKLKNYLPNLIYNLCNPVGRVAV